MTDIPRENGCDAALADVFSATLMGDPARSTPAQILDLGEREIGLFFPEPLLPILRIGEEASLCLEAVFLERPILLAVRVVLRTEMSGGRHYGCEVLDPAGFVGQLPEVAHRCLAAPVPAPVRPDPRAPVFATLAAAASLTEARGRVEELSGTGMTVSVAGRSEQELGTTDRVRVFLRLPSGPDRLGLWGAIRQRRLTRVAIRYAVAFDPQATWRFELQQEQIDAYLRARRQQLGTR